MKFPTKHFFANGLPTLLPRRWLKFSLAGIASVPCLAPGAATASDLDSLQDLAQQQFKILVENTGAATHYKAIAPAEPLGLVGFDVALELSVTDINKEVFDIASAGGYDLSRFVVPRIHVHKGLPFGIDIGAFYTAIPDTDFKAMGGELRYAILEGSSITPAVAIRGHYSVIQGIDELDLNSAGVELTVSKGVLMLTPYAGIGMIRTTGTPNDIAGLVEESVDMEKVYVGLNVNLGLNFGAEIDRTGEYTTYSLKAGLRF